MQKLIDGEWVTLEEIIEKHIPIVRRYAYKLSVRVPYEDLVSEGVTGLIEAYNNFDADRGIQFNTYGGRSAYSKMIRALNAWTVGYYYPHHIRELSVTIRGIDKELSRSYEDLSAETGKPIHHIKSAIEYIRTRTGVSIDSEVSVGEGKKSVSEFIPSDIADETVVYKDDFEKLLNEKESEFLKMMFDEIEISVASEVMKLTRETTISVRDTIRLKMFFYLQGREVGILSDITFEELTEPEFFETLDEIKKFTVLSMKSDLPLTVIAVNEGFSRDKLVGELRRVRKSYVVWKSNK